jgi:L-fuconolactonase
MQVDSHQHFWKYDVQRHSWITEEMKVLKRDYLPADLLPELRANGMDGCIAVQADQSEQETEFLLKLADQHDVIKGVVGWVDLQSPEISERLQHFSQFKKLCGFRHVVQSEADDGFMLRPEFCRGINALRKYSFTYDILIYARQLPAALELVARFPDQPFVIDHIAKPSIRTGSLAPWAAQMRALADHANVYCKVSGLITEADWRNWRTENLQPYLNVVFETFGPERLMFGSDWPVCLLAGSYKQVKQLIETYIGKLSIKQKKDIFGLNAVRFYGLESTPNGSAT